MSETAKRTYQLQLLLGLSAIVFFGVWLWIGFPYNMLPSDERYYLTADPFTTHYPLFILAVQGAGAIWSLFSSDQLSTLLFFNLLCQSLILILLGHWIFEATKSYFATAISLLLFGTSPWMAKYFFWASYTPFATLLFLSALWCLWRTLNPPCEALNRKQMLYLVGAGALSGAGVLSSASGALMACILGAGLFVVHFQLPRLEKLQRFKLFLAGIVGILVPFSFFWIPIIVDYWQLNINTWHYARALKRHGFVPKPPFMTLFHMGAIFEVGLFVFFAFSSAIILAWSLLKKKISPIQNSLAFLTLLVWVHAILLDLSPFTKLGRTHFAIYPVLILCTVCILTFLIRQLSEFKNIRILSSLAVGLLLVFCVGKNIWANHQMVKAKQYAPKFVKGITNTDFYVLEFDPHAAMIARWMRVPAKPIRTLGDIASPPGKRVAVLVGPQGKDSGKSVLHDGNAGDLNLETVGIKKPEKASEVKLPYFSYFPNFLMEEEVSQGLYFMGLTPKHDSETAKMTMWIWNAAAE